MKAILVIDMPEHFKIEETKAYRIVLSDGFVMEDLGIDYPLRPMPEKMTLNGAMNVGYGTDGFAYRNGWNACIDEIFGETE